MHDAAYRYIAQQVEQIKQAHMLKHGRATLDQFDVIEVGAYNVNGSVRPLFTGARSYLGLDMRAGPNVDRVCKVQSVTAELGESADIVITSESLEHDADHLGHLLAALLLVRPMGWLLITAAAPERTPHGVNGDALALGEPYLAVHPMQLYDYLKIIGAESVQIDHDSIAGDVYAVARRGIP